MTRNALVLMVALGLMACGGSEDVEQRGLYTNPGPVKADGTNSCVGTCGGQALDGCWCDSLCVGFGDCCSDYATTCVTAKTCGDLTCGTGYHCEIKGINGGSVPEGINGGSVPVCIQGDAMDCLAVDCGAGYHCEMKGINGGSVPVCIMDAADCTTQTCPTGYHCEMKGINGGSVPVCIMDAVMVCGPWLGGQCPTNKVCDIQACGVGTGGICIEQPTADSCIDLMYKPFEPVCGCDGKTYNNDCLRQAAGTSLDHQGAC